MTNADKFKHFERWATASDFPVDNIVNDGTTSYDSRFHIFSLKKGKKYYFSKVKNVSNFRLGALADLSLCLRAKGVSLESGEDVCVIAGDMLFQVTKL